MKINDEGIIKYGKDDLGVIVEGASLYSSTEQSFRILEFAAYSGMAIDQDEIQDARMEFELDRDDLPYDWFEDLGFAVEQALYWLNTNCTEKGVAFAFIDTDLVLLDSNYESMVG